jgi:hypothetical protein
MIRLQLFGHETAANHFREEGRHCHLAWDGGLYDWRNHFRPLIMRPLHKPWTPQEEERLMAFAAQGASAIKVAAALKRSKLSIRERAKRLGCPFPLLRTVRKKWADTPNNEWRS